MVDVRITLRSERHETAVPPIGVPQHRMRRTNGCQRSDEPLVIGPLVRSVPVEPRGLVVLVVRVVVPSLRSGELVTGDEHRDAVAEQQQTHRVAELAATQRHHLRRHVDVALPATVPRPVVVVAVGVVPAVRLVVPMVVGDQVVHGEAVVGGQEVERTHRRGEQVGASGEPFGHQRHHARLATQEPANIVAELPVPLHPPLIREVGAEEVARHVPRFGDQPDASTFAPVADRSDEVGVAGQHRSEVEPEPVDAEVGEAVERLHDQPPRLRRVRVDHVARARIVEIRPIGPDDVVLALVEDPQRVVGTLSVLLGRVVHHDVEPHLDVVIVRSRHQIGEFLGGMVAGGVLTVHRSEHERHVAPVVALVGVVLMHRQQFEHRDPELGEPREFADGCTEGAGVGPRSASGEPAHVRLVHDERTRGAALRARRRPRGGDRPRKRGTVERADALVRGPRVSVREPHLGRSRVERQPVDLRRRSRTCSRSAPGPPSHPSACRVRARSGAHRRRVPAPIGFPRCEWRCRTSPRWSDRRPRRT